MHTPEGPAPRRVSVFPSVPTPGRALGVNSDGSNHKVRTNSHHEQDHGTQHSACVHTVTLSHTSLPTQATRATSEGPCQARPAPATRPPQGPRQPGR